MGNDQVDLGCAMLEDCLGHEWISRSGPWSRDVS